MKKKTFLIEIGTEEMPSKFIKKIAKNFYYNLESELKKYLIKFYKMILFHSPRRIAIQIIKINTSDIIQKYQNRGPSIKNSFNEEGLLTISAKKWLKKFNITIKQTKILENEKGKWLLYEHQKNKININNILPKIIISSIKNIKIAQSMIWKDKKIKFSRPIRNITMLLNEKKIISNILGIRSNRYLYGNISTIPYKIKINHANEYEELLYNKGKVIANFKKRKNIIYDESHKTAKKISGKLNINTNLLDEITCLVEWPVILYGKFKKKFLIIPSEILIYIMESIQKYFPIYNLNNQLTCNFIIVSNNPSTENNNIIIGNERVLNAKLYDINFFLKNDIKNTLQEYFPLLKNIIFHEKLGSMYEKSKRLIILIQYIIKYTNANIEKSIKSAYLSKCDLITQMVYEFPELQGIMGMNYSIYHGECKKIALSLKEQYQPKFSGDNIPSNIIGCSLSLTDKIDTIVGLFLIKKHPKKNKDPFALRRLTIGIIRIIIEKKININLNKIIHKSIKIYKILDINQKIENKILKFIMDRLYTWYKEKKYNIEIIKSVFLCNINNCLDIDNRIQAIHQLYPDKLFQDLMIIKKRIHNLIKKINININQDYQISKKLLIKNEEKKLFNEIKNIKKILYPLIIKKKYKESIKTLYYLSNFINNFINNVSINDKNKKIKINRIALLTQIKNFFLKIADF